jgi:acyl-CoA thioesterase
VLIIMSLDPRSTDARAFGGVDPAAIDAAQTLAEDCARAMWKNDAASQALGMRVDEVGPGRAVLVMRVRPDMLNGHKTCHGGLLFALADSAFGFACNSHDRATVAAGCSIEFVSPGRAGELLRAEAVERTRSGRTGVYDVTVSGEDGRAVALFRGKSHELKGRVIGA